jgi:DNA polymerase-4
MILCRDCDALFQTAQRCPVCDGARLVSHPELTYLTIAHIDCDAFFASVEKRDRPDLRDRPLIVGGSTRGVVAACCYIARLSGVRSAMPIFKALQLCPDATIIPPDFAKYSEASRQIRTLMNSLTPLVQPLSIDEAALDLSGTETLHRAPPAVMLSRLARRIEQEVGVTVSIGLAANRLLAKLAAERDKPRGFAVLGRNAASLLAAEPITLLPGVGPALARKLTGMSITRIGDLARLDPIKARRMLGEDGPSLVARANGIDHRRVDPTPNPKSISAETTFAENTADPARLHATLIQLAEKLARRLRQADSAAGNLSLKLRTARFETRSFAVPMHAPTQLSETIRDAATPILRAAADGTAYRLLGIGTNRLVPASEADHGDLLDHETPRRAARQRAIDHLTAKFGPNSIRRGTPPDTSR